MTTLARIGTLALLLAVGTSLGCSKDKDEATTKAATATTDTKATATAGTKDVAEAKNVAGMAKETLLALKFHHDS